MKTVCIVLLLILMCTGCASIVVRNDDPWDEPTGVYPATRADVVGAYRYCKGDLQLFWPDAGPSRPNLIEQLLWCTFTVIDLPFSLVTDTLCFPWDLFSDPEKRKAQTTN